MKHIKLLLTQRQFDALWSAVQLSIATPRGGDVDDEAYPTLEALEAKLKKAAEKARETA